MLWQHFPNLLSDQSGRSVPHPQTILEWEDDMKKWPHITYEDIFNYVVLSLGADGSTMRNYKSTEAYQYLHSGKVGKVLISNNINDLIFLKADVNPSQSKSDAHSAWILTTSTGTVETAGCTCVAGLGKSCSHAAAILWKVQYAVSKGLTGWSCTDEQRHWNSGTQRNLVPKRLNNISFQHHRESSDFSENIHPISPSLPPTPAYTSHEALKVSLEAASIPLGSLLHKCISAVPDQVVAAHTQLQQPHDEHGTDKRCQKCMAFYDRYIKLDGDKCAVLEELTKMQSASHLWFDARKLRVTGSSAKKVPVRASTRPENFLREHLFPRFHGNTATRYGQENEKVAYAWLESCGFVVEKRGTVVSVTEPWLSASPDGVVNSTELLEIECPVLTKNCASLADVFSSKFTDVKM
ncbi:PREDICTED: uncharacterized protein LOC107105150, partial [Cyprinodon variegatus]|uniref:uncharacterized protein LOC107105150 n=1 Tax=Cyprinodon variegatus TaxID=28743 RepID=UPI0007426CA9